MALYPLSLGWRPSKKDIRKRLDQYHGLFHCRHHTLREHLEDHFLRYPK